MTKASGGRRLRRRNRRLAEQEAAKLTPAEARRKLAEWAAAGGNLADLDRRPRPVAGFVEANKITIEQMRERYP